MIVVGEVNPYGADPRFALYHEPPHAAGGRLRDILLMSVRAYVQIAKVNLCVGTWSLLAARVAALAIAQRARVEGHGTVVLLGRKVAQAFYVDLDFFETMTVVPAQTTLGDAPTTTPGLTLALLPHPSGLSRAWNDPTAAARARRLIRQLEPTVPVGGDS